MKCPKCGEKLSYERVKRALKLASDVSYAVAYFQCAVCGEFLETYYPLHELKIQNNC